jgi:hypothetical protein
VEASGGSGLDCTAGLSTAEARCERDNREKGGKERKKKGSEVAI